MWPANPWDFVPEDGSGRLGVRNSRIVQTKILDALGVEMNLTTIGRGQAFDQLGDSPFGSVAAVHEWRNNRNAQVSEPRRVALEPASRRVRSEKKETDPEAEIAFPEAAKGRR